MASDQPVTTAEPIFYETLAAAAVCSPADAAEHFAALREKYPEFSDRRAHLVETFLEEYVAHA